MSRTTTTRLPTSSTTSRSCARPALFRFANHLAAWVEIEEGRIVDGGYSGSGLMGPTSVRLANLRTTFEPVPLPDIRHEPEVSDVGRALRADHRRAAPGSPRPVA